MSSEEKQTEVKSHSQELAEKHGVSGHKNADKLYWMAYERGHSAGIEEVESYYAEMVELLK
jgi:hypothetical protein